MMLRFNRIFLTLMISLHLAYYLSGNKAYLISDNNHIDAYLSCYKHQQDRQFDKHNTNNKNKSKSECYSPA